MIGRLKGGSQSYPTIAVLLVVCPVNLLTLWRTIIHPTTSSTREHGAAFSLPIWQTAL